MKIDYDVGDVVVCIDASVRSGPTYKSGFKLTQGALYRVALISFFQDDGSPAVLLEGDTVDGDSAWEGDRFKKLPKADDQFTAMIRKARQKEDA